MQVTLEYPFPIDKMTGAASEGIVFITDGGGFNAERRLTPDEGSLYATAIRFLSGVTESWHLLDASRINHKEFQDTYAALEQSGLEDEQSRDAEHHALEVNRRLSNYLSSFRLYLDYSEARLKRAHGNASPEAEGFKRLCSAVYDQSFAYRFAYKLRNYSQHFGMPIGHIHGDSKLVPGPPESTVHAISVRFSVAELLANSPDGWGTVKQDLLTGPPLLDVLPIVQGAAASLRRVHEGVSEIEHAYLRGAARAVYQTLGGTAAEARRRVVGSYVNDGGLLAIDFAPPPLGVLQVCGFPDIPASDTEAV